MAGSKSFENRTKTRVGLVFMRENRAKTAEIVRIGELMMAKNKISWSMEYDKENRAHYYFTGSQRQPTLAEIHNFIIDNRLQDKIDDFFGVTYINFTADEWVYPEECLTVEVIGYNGGSHDGDCPVCGHERDMSGSRCPVCDKPWEDAQ
jgi:hypothetical protein